MALNFPDPATQTPVNTWSPTSTPSASTNGLTYLWDGAKWTTEGGVPNLHWTRAGSVLSPTNAGDDVQIASLNSGPLSGFRNQIINGSFAINQRSITDTSARNLYFVDRWFKGDSAGRIVVVDSTLAGFDRMLSFSGAADSPIYQAIELPRTGKPGKFAVGTTWTLSCYARCASGGDIRLSKRFVNNHNQNITDETAQAFTLDANWQHIAFTFTIASAPNAANTGLQALIVALTTNEVFVTGAQLEPGPVATLFEYRLGELALCQRYYQKAENIRTISLTRSQNASTTGQCFAYLPFPVQMRATPTVASFGTWDTTAGNEACTPDAPSVYGVRIRTAATNKPAGTIVSGHGGGYTADAEL